MISKKKRSSPKFNGFFRQKSEFQGFFFRPNTGDLQAKKKKGLHRNSKGFSGRNQKFKGFIWPNAGDLQQKKVFPEIQRVFPAEIRNSKVFSGRNQVISKNRSSPTLGELLNQKNPLFWSKQRQVFHNFGSQISLGGGCFHLWSKNRP